MPAKKKTPNLLSVLTPRPMRLVVKGVSHLRELVEQEKGYYKRLKRKSEYKYGTKMRAKLTRRAMYRGGPLE